MKRLKLFLCIALLFAPVLSSQQGYIPFATDFDGSADHFLRGSDLDGSADSKSGIFSGWGRLDGGDGGTNEFLHASVKIQVFRNTDNLLWVRMQDAASGTAIELRSTGAHVAGPAWFHLLASWDVAAGESHFYVDDVSEKNETVNSDLLIDYTQTDYALGGSIGGSALFNGGISEVYFAPGQFLDFSVVANRRMFITADLKPVDLGPSGYKPTGTAPLIYMCNQFNGFGTNCGTGGDFTPQDPVTSTVGPVPILEIPGRAEHGQARGRGGRGGRSR